MEGSGLANGRHRREQSSTEVAGLGECSRASADGVIEISEFYFSIGGGCGIGLPGFRKVGGDSFILRN
jgi:hypothetical protein